MEIWEDHEFLVSIKKKLLVQQSSVESELMGSLPT